MAQPNEISMPDDADEDEQAALMAIRETGGYVSWPVLRDGVWLAPGVMPDGETRIVGRGATRLAALQAVEAQARG